ncbi:FecR domain-containing protein [Luteolibacter marinus]|uniref:FecR domain-containing protein n=1 Tax=Luteolibacter marinus TaxID=2776705 RepID=UPI001866EC82|nr:FecR domain-containing protein [Luteolibacter marinus]
MKDDHHYEKLIHELLDGTITSDDARRLETILLQDPEARRTYCSLTSIDQLLVEDFGSADRPIAHARQGAAANGWSEKRRRGHPWRFSFASAAAILVAGLFALVMIRLKKPDIPIAVSTDGRVLVDGRIGPARHWKPSEKLSVEQGVMVVRLNPATELCVESPAEIVLRDASGSFELQRGRAWVRTGTGAPDFTAQVQGASIRHIGTRFGMISGDGGAGEVHVEEGMVELTRNGVAPLQLSAGEARAWSVSDPALPAPAVLQDFQQSLPVERTLFSDNFNEEEGTPLARKKPDVGSPWMVLREKHPTRVGGGMLDTSGGYRNLAAQFQPLALKGGRTVYLVTIFTAEPARLSDKTSRLNGSESVALWDSGGSRIFSLVARAADGHRWRLRDDIGDRETEPVDVSALEEHPLTLCYDPVRGGLALYAGASAQAERLAELPLSEGSAPASLTVENDDGGDLALRRIDVRAVHYPRDSGGAARR